MDYYEGDVSMQATPAKEYKLPMGELDTDFKKEFPPDPQLGHELDDGARVWKVYRKEATAYDNDMLDGWGGTLDILLIFAGLFSAVVTAFVIESYALLQPDNTAYMAAALYIIAVANNASAVLPPPPSLELSPSQSSRWINGLWFTSLLLSITVAFLCILVKQWIREYKARNTASAQSPKHWARRREIFFQALGDWPVGELVSILPVLLHLSLFLFFAGIIAFLWPLDRAVGIWIVVLSLILAVFYACCTLIPVWLPECPTSTPLAHMVRKQLIPVELFLLRVCASALARLQQYANAALDILWRLVPRHGPRDWRQNTNSLTMLPLRAASYLRRPLAFRLQSLIEAIKAQQSGTYFSEWSERNSVALDAAALQWTIFEVSDSDSVAVGLQALGALPLDSELARHLRLNDRLRTFTADAALTRTAGVQNAAEALRALRSLLCMQGANYRDDNRLGRDIASLDAIVLSKADYPDAALVHAVVYWELSSIVENATAWRRASSTLTSTAVSLMQTRKINVQVGLASGSWTICFLLCCDFEQLLDGDWLEVIHDLSEELAPSQPADRLHFGLRCKELSVAELVATALITNTLRGDQLFTVELSAKLTKASANIIGRLLLQIPSTDYGLITRCPFLLDCLSAGHFFSQEIDVSPLAECLFSIGMAFSMERNTIPKQVWHAAAHVVHKSPKEPKMGLNYAMRFCQDRIYAALELQGPLQERDSRLSEALDLILYPLNIPDIDMSLWEMLSIDFGERANGDTWLLLAEALSTALCARDHGNDEHNGHLDAYFVGSNSANFLTVTSSFWSAEKCTFDNDFGRQYSLRLVQHNVELRPRWWKDILDSQLGNDAYTEMIEGTDEEFREEPVCRSTWCSVHRPRTPEPGLVESGSS